jgi:hypothetical protein
MAFSRAKQEVFTYSTIPRSSSYTTLCSSIIMFSKLLDDYFDELIITVDCYYLNASATISDSTLISISSSDSYSLVSAGMLLLGLWSPRSSLRSAHRLANSIESRSR